MRTNSDCVRNTSPRRERGVAVRRERLVGFLGRIECARRQPRHLAWQVGQHGLEGGVGPDDASFPDGDDADQVVVQDRLLLAQQRVDLQGIEDLFRDVGMRHDGIAGSRSSERRHHHSEPALPAWRMARVFAAESRSTAVEHAANAVDRILNGLRIVADAGPAGIKVIDADAGVRRRLVRHPAVFQGISVPGFVDRHDHAMAVEHGDLRDHGVQDVLLERFARLECGLHLLALRDVVDERIDQDPTIDFHRAAIHLDFSNFTAGQAMREVER